MSQDFFRIIKGLELDNIQLLEGTGAPGAAGDPSLAPVGSFYLNESNGDAYTKILAGVGTNKWQRLASTTYVDSVAAGISWREPVVVRDNTVYANVAAAEAAANVADTVDGQPINATTRNRILLTNLTTGNRNVYIVSGSTGAWTFTEDTNLATDGDALLVQEGTSADQQWVYDGANWVQFSSAVGAAELAYIRAFIGKTTSGPSLPNYPSNDLVIDNENLTYELGRLDDAVGTLTFTTPNLLKSYSDALGTFASPGSQATYDITTNLKLIDDAFGTGNITNTGGNWAVSADANWYVGGSLSVTSILDELNEGIGNATFTSSGTNITNGDSANTSINNLNEALIPLQQEALTITGSQVATISRIMDYLAVTTATEVKWMIQVRATGTPANRRAVELHALTDGTNIDHTEYAVLKLGANISGIAFNVAISTGLILTLGALTGGSLYANGVYTNVPLTTGGSGVGATANITVSGGAVTAVTIVNKGTGYAVLDTLSAADANLGGAGGSGFLIPVATVTGTVMALTVNSNPGVDYVVKRIAYSKF